jgi:preprotein translocase subunit SecF
MKFSFANWGNALYQGTKNYKFIQNRKWFYSASIILICACILFVVVNGFNLGIEFKGGSEFKITSVTDTSQQKAIDSVKSILPGEEPAVAVIGENTLRIQTQPLEEGQLNKVRDALAKTYNIDKSDVTINSIGPTWGSDVLTKAVNGLLLFLLIAAIFMAIYFHNIAMAIGGIAALLHDMVITVGLYALIGWEITPATMIGFLTILGYSMYDTVVVFDKVRENTAHLESQTRATYEEYANLAVNQTMVRSINTTVVALLPVGSVLFVGAFILGAGTLRDIALALFIGMLVGAYSSIFLATPIVVSLTTKQKKIQAHTASVLAKREKLAESEGLDIDDPSLLAAVAPAQLLPGEHQGRTAQPHKVPKSKRK